MTAYLIRRLFQMVVVVFVVSLFMFFLFNIAPGGPLTGLQQQQRRITPEERARIRAQYELDLYWPIRYTRWLIGWPQGPIVVGGQELFANIPVGCYIEATPEEGGGCHQYVYLADMPRLHPPARSSQGILFGDFGRSTVVQAGRPVWDLLMSRLWATVELQVISLVLSLLIAVPLGIYSAVHQYSRFDYTFTTAAFIGSSMPTFFFGLLFILMFTILAGRIQEILPWWPTLPPGLREAVRPYDVASWLTRVQPGSALDRFLHLLMPVSVLTIVSVAAWSRFLRSSMLEVLRQDYVRTARAKGLPERIVINKHALRNALIPFVTVLVLQIPLFFAGAIVTETIFAWPGMGRLYFDALNRSDYNIALAFIYVTTILTVFATLLGDILYAVIDPRIRYS
ncbi:MULTISPECIES: ABC transporter permease [Caldilinea]|jgi:peptide/nickel transport system permease protein|uniref:ABC transporter permease n=2 Tax=Caldilinea aerophila TaxID=133453 RepID=A0A7C1FF92_9CHLR|nr:MULTISPECIES: ABC transporter permease [Caldilinea]MBO9394639.1 ABC transporter permease [Caldilinea sp.]BAL99148.1 putative ABC transporter permease protein [Caldilinea aerophila DSM 14535 = NBRC 104270]GIV74261.1 MAG: ABC transporter permease [Caldilinea sp.]